MATEIFGTVFGSGGGGIVRECECGRVHYSSQYSDANCFDEGELERLEQWTETQPDRYISHDHSIGTMMIPFVGEVVYDCPCERAEKAERILQSQAARLARYLNAYSGLLREEAENASIEDADVFSE